MAHCYDALTEHLGRVAAAKVTLRFPEIEAGYMLSRFAKKRSGPEA
jgi:hypothetical protein